MIGVEDAPYTFEYDDYFKILPAITTGQKIKTESKVEKVADDFLYSSNNNNKWMSSQELSNWIDKKMKDSH